MSRRSLLARGGLIEKSRVVITLAPGTTVLPLYLNGSNIKITDKDDTVLYSALAPAAPNSLVIPAAPADNQYTIEVGWINQLYLTSGTSLQKVLEFKIKNQATVRMNYCTNLTEVRNIDVSATTALNNLFDGCTNLTTIDPFTIKDGSICSAMFRGTKISSIPVTNLKDASNVDNIFSGCTLLNDISVLHNIDLKWISMVDFVSNSGVSVIENLRFINLVNFLVRTINSNATNITAIRNIYAPLVTRISCTYLVNLVEFSNVTTGAVTNLNSAFLNCSSLLAVPILTASTTNLNCSRTFQGCTSLSNIDNFVTIYNNFTGSTINCSNLFMNCTALVNVPITDFRKMIISHTFANTGITSLSNIIAPNASGMFYGCYQLLTVTNATFEGSTSNAFSYSRLTSITATIAGSSMSNMFEWCLNLSSASITCTAPVATNLDFQNMFDRCFKLDPNTLTISIPNNNKYNAMRMFSYCNNTNFTQPPSTLDYSRATSVESMFVNCAHLTSTGNLTLTECVTASGMFESCSSLANVGNISAPIATSCSYFFSLCSALVTVAGTLSFPNCTDFSAMFSNCYLLNHIPAIDTTGATIFNAMFVGARAITVYNNNYNLSSATTLQSMFSGCNELTSVTISDTFTTTNTGSSVISVIGMFSSSLKLTNVVFADASKFTTSTANNTFGSNTKVTNLVYPGFRTIMELPPLITDVTKIEAYVNSAGTPRFGTNKIIQLGATRKASISQTVIDNAVAKGWTVT